MDKNMVTHFKPMLYFFTPEYIRKPLAFSGGIEMENWPEMG